MTIPHDTPELARQLGHVPLFQRPGRRGPGAHQRSGALESDRIVLSGRQRVILTKPHALVALAEDLPER